MQPQLQERLTKSVDDNQKRGSKILHVLKNLDYNEVMKGINSQAPLHQFTELRKHNGVMKGIN